MLKCQLFPIVACFILTELTHFVYLKPYDSSNEDYVGNSNPADVSNASDVNYNSQTINSSSFVFSGTDMLQQFSGSLLNAIEGSQLTFSGSSDCSATFLPTVDFFHVQHIEKIECDLNRRCYQHCMPHFSLRNGSSVGEATCKQGYWTLATCYPSCFPECKFGRCVAPNTCDCMPGYSGAACELVTAPCVAVRPVTLYETFKQNLQDETKGTIICWRGYALPSGVESFNISCINGNWTFPNEQRCQPVCSPPCSWGWCTPEFRCSCYPGYTGSSCTEKICLDPKPSLESMSQQYIQKVCGAEADFNNSKIAANVECRGGAWVASISYIYCSKQCDPDCLNGGTCVGSNACQCAHGYVGPRCEALACGVPPFGGQYGNRYINQSEGSLTCLQGYRLSTGQSSIKFFCYKGKWSFPSPFSVMSPPRCRPRCYPPCLNGGRCVGPQVCNCVEGFMGSRCQYRFYSSRTGPCVFPFMFNGQYYFSCTRAAHELPWCATRVDPNTRAVQQWALCYAHLGYSSFIAASSGRECIFPYYVEVDGNNEADELKVKTMFGCVGGSGTRLSAHGVASYCPTALSTYTYTPVMMDRCVIYSEYTQNVTLTHSGQQCVFPFLFEGRWVWRCQGGAGDHTSMWCAVHVHQNGSVAKMDYCIVDYGYARSVQTLSGKMCDFVAKTNDSITIYDCQSDHNLLPVFDSTQDNSTYYCSEIERARGTCITDYVRGMERSALVLSFTSHMAAQSLATTRLMLTLTGERCVFPFMHGSVTYHSCVTSSGALPWCATAVDATRTVIEAQYCAPDWHYYLQRVSAMRFMYAGRSDISSFVHAVEEVLKLRAILFDGFIRVIGSYWFNRQLYGQSREKIYMSLSPLEQISRSMSSSADAGAPPLIAFLSNGTVISGSNPSTLPSMNMYTLFNHVMQRLGYGQSSSQNWAKFESIRVYLNSYQSGQNFFVPEEATQTIEFILSGFDISSLLGVQILNSSLSSEDLRAQQKFITTSPIVMATNSEPCIPFLYMGEWRGYGSCVSGPNVFWTSDTVSINSTGEAIAGLSNDSSGVMGWCATAVSSQGDPLLTAPCITPSYEKGFWPNSLPALQNPRSAREVVLQYTVSGHPCLEPLEKCSLHPDKPDGSFWCAKRVHWTSSASTASTLAYSPKVLEIEECAPDLEIVEMLPTSTTTSTTITPPTETPLPSTLPEHQDSEYYKLLALSLYNILSRYQQNYLNQYYLTNSDVPLPSTENLLSSVLYLPTKTETASTTLTSPFYRYITSLLYNPKLTSNSLQSAKSSFYPTPSSASSRDMLTNYLAAAWYTNILNQDNVQSSASPETASRDSLFESYSDPNFSNADHLLLAYVKKLYPLYFRQEVFPTPTTLKNLSPMTPSEVVNILGSSLYSGYFTGQDSVSTDTRNLYTFTVNDQACVFPFLLNEVRYDDCADLDSLYNTYYYTRSYDTQQFQNKLGGSHGMCAVLVDDKGRAIELDYCKAKLSNDQDFECNCRSEEELKYCTLLSKYRAVLNSLLMYTKSLPTYTI